jgi:cysteate synthase
MDANGEVLLSSNEEAEAMATIFLEMEGIDIHSAAAVAVASLVTAVRENKIKKNAVVMLYITGGGEVRFKKEQQLVGIKPAKIFDNNPDKEMVKNELLRLFRNLPDHIMQIIQTKFLFVKFELNFQ